MESRTAQLEEYTLGVRNSFQQRIEAIIPNWWLPAARYGAIPFYIPNTHKWTARQERGGGGD